MRPRVLVVAIALFATAGCGYHLVKLELPAAAGECVHLDDLDGGEAHPELAQWATDSLRAQLGADLCAPGQAGATLTGTVQWVIPDESLMEVSGAGQVLAGSTWIAAATIRIVEDDATIWGPEGVEVRRDFLSTGSPVTENAAMQSHIQLLATDLGEALAELLRTP